MSNFEVPGYAVTFRGFPACPCQPLWLTAYEHELQRRRIIPGGLPISQLIGGFGPSGGTHTDGGVGDFILTGTTADRATWVARQMGADATWHRPPNWDGRNGIEHVHSAMRGCPHLSPQAQAQIWAVDHNGDGLVGDAPDPGPRPLSGRTWREGIAWAMQQEDDMPAPKDWDSDDWAAIVKNVVPEVAKAVWMWDGFNNAKDKAKALLLLASGK